MTSRDFCFWLQGLFELAPLQKDAPTRFDLSAEQAFCIRKHLALVFIHEIDPTLKAAHARMEDIVQKIHEAALHPPKTVTIDPMVPSGHGFPKQNPLPGDGPQFRC